MKKFILNFTEFKRKDRSDKHLKQEELKITLTMISSGDTSVFNKTDILLAITDQFKELHFPETISLEDIKQPTK